MKPDLDKLKAPFPIELISWRVGATNAKKNNGKATKGIALAYIDARDVMQRLDDVCGVNGWQNGHPHANGKTSCKIGIKIGDEWVWKENGAGDSATEAEKGAFSDSFKRAAVLWGIGRYLYDVPNIWVELDEWAHIKNPSDQKLKSALDQAAKGIRLAHEAEPEAVPIKPVLSDEFKDLKARLMEPKNNTELESAKGLARAAYHRMNNEQQVAIKIVIDDMVKRLVQAP